MTKSKIAISVDNSLLKLVDSKVDHSVIRSRSQAIEFFLKKGLQEQSVSTAVLLLKGEHQAFSLKQIKGISLLKQQIEFFSKHGIKTLYIVTQHTKNMNQLLDEISDAKIEDGIVTIRGRDTATRAMLIGRERSNINHLAGIVKRYFDVREMNVV